MTSDDLEQVQNVADKDNQRSMPGLGERLRDLQVSLVEQEHRALVLLRLFFRDRKKWTNDDKRHDALKAALAWRLLFSPATVAAAGGGVALLTCGLLFWQNDLIEGQNEIATRSNALIAEQTIVAKAQSALLASQNELIESQNNFFRRQIQQEAIQDYRSRRAQLISTIYDQRKCWKGEQPNMHENQEENSIGCPSASPQVRAAATISLAALERDVRTSPEDWPGVAVAEETSLLRADLRTANLLNAKLNNVNFGAANLAWTHLYGADLSGSYLVMSNLNYADLSEADLSGARLREANLQNATIWDANLSRADLSKADLTQASLMGSDLSGARLNGAKAHKADLVRAILKRAVLRGADLEHADLENSDLREANLAGANLAGANLAGAKFDRCLYCPVGSEDVTVWPGLPPEKCRVWKRCK